MSYLLKNLFSYCHALLSKNKYLFEIPPQRHPSSLPHLNTLTGGAAGYSAQCIWTVVELPYIVEVDVGVVHVALTLVSTLLPVVSLIPNIAHRPTKLSSRLLVWPINLHTYTSFSFSARIPLSWTSG